MTVVIITYRVRDEIEEVVGDKPIIDADDVDKLAYMNQVYLWPFVNKILLLW